MLPSTALIRPRVICAESIIPPCCTTPAGRGPNGSLRIIVSQRQNRTVKHTVYSNTPTPRGSMDRCVAAHGLRMLVRLRSHSRITGLLPVRGGCTLLILRRQQVKMLELRRARHRRPRLPDVPRPNVVRVVMYSS